MLTPKLKLGQTLMPEMRGLTKMTNKLEVYGNEKLTATRHKDFKADGVEKILTRGVGTVTKETRGQGI